MNNKHFSIQDARKIDLVEYLAKLGYQPVKIRNLDYWYASPLRDEKTPSFKVNRGKNLWYDFGLGEGGTIIDFGIKYFKCSVKEFLGRLKFSKYNTGQPSLSIQHNKLVCQAADEDRNRIKIVDVHYLKSPELISYLRSRLIDLEIAKKYCQEVNFELYNKYQSAIGFKNDKGGFELRNASFKGSSSPKFTTLFDSENDYKNLVVFEGFFNFLSYQTVLQSYQQLPESQTNYLILNSLSFFEISKSLMESHHSVRLFLDRDKAGIDYTQKALRLRTNCTDCSHVYKGFKDYNDLLVNKPLKQEQALKIRRHF